MYTGGEYRRRRGVEVAYTEARKKANEKWTKENYKQVKLSMPNAEAEALEKFCEARELSKAGFIREAIKEKMERDSQTDIKE